MAYIDWIDHSYNDSRDWRTAGDIIERLKEDIVIRSYGKIIYEDDRKVIIAAEQRLDKDIHNPIYRAYTTIHKQLEVKRGK